MTKTKKIDVHAHVNAFGDLSPKYSFCDCTLVTPEKLLSAYDKLNIEKGVLLPIVSPEATVRIVTCEECLSVVQKYPDRFIPFCNIDPRQYTNKPDGELEYLLNHYLSLGAKGVGEVTANLYVDDLYMDKLFEVLAKHKLPVTIHISPAVGESYGIVDDAGLPRLEAILKKYPDLKVLGHSQLFWTEISKSEDGKRELYPKGKVTEGRIAELLRKYPNLYCDVSANSGANAFMRDRDYAKKFIAEFSDRILYGCDICAPGINEFPFVFDAFLDDMLISGDISQENYDKFVRKNAEKLLGL